MSIYDSTLWSADRDETIAAFPELDALSGNAVLITGCTGLIGSALTDLLIRWNETHAEKIRLFAAGRDTRKIEARFAPYAQADWFCAVPYDASATKNALAFSCDYIVHAASNAFPGMIVKEPVETMLGNFLGLKCLLDYAKARHVKRVLYVSSSEIYGQKDGNQPYRETDCGYVESLNPRSAYPVGKRAAETLCAAYVDEYGTDSVIVRPGHIYGPTASPFDNRVSSAWAYAAARGEDIVMKSDGAQIRSYCYCLDCASAIIAVLLKGETVHAYNISNPDSIITIKQMAELLTKAADVALRMEAPTEAEKKGFNPMSNSSLNAESLLALGWRGVFDARRGFFHTVSILRDAFGMPSSSGRDV